MNEQRDDLVNTPLDPEGEIEVNRTLEWLATDERTASRYAHGWLSPIEVARAAVLAQRAAVKS